MLEATEKRPIGLKSRRRTGLPAADRHWGANGHTTASRCRYLPPSSFVIIEAAELRYHFPWGYLNSLGARPQDLLGHSCRTYSGNFYA